MAEANDPNDRDYLQSLSEKEMPAFLGELPDEQLSQLRAYVEYAIERRTAGLDKFFQMSAEMAKFAPNFLHHRLIPKFLEPPITAAIAIKMNTREAAGIAGGLSDDYVAESSLFMDDDAKAMEILEKLSTAKARRIVALVCQRNHLRALELLAGASDAQIRKLTSEVDWSPFRGLELRDEHHQASLERLRGLVDID